MPTLLTTSKMSPELVARIESSVSGRRVKAGDSSLPPLVKGILRIGVVAIACFAVYSFVDVRRRESRQLEQDRSALLESLRAQTSSITADDQKADAKDDAWLSKLSGPWEGDLDELGTKSALDALLSRGSVWVRGPIDGFTSPAKINATAAASGKDAFLLCLADPPASRMEKNVLGRVRIAYDNGTALEQPTSKHRRLEDAKRGLPLLQPAFADRVRAAPDSIAVKALKKELDGASLDKTRDALRARVLVAVMDEPAQAGGITEMDGERVHDIRVFLVDLAADKVVFRTRKRVDPSEWGAVTRAQFASGLDGCALAFDVRDNLR
jgi:hypothetical protein